MANNMRLVVIESPYAGDVERNVRYARACMGDCLKRGEAPLASHLLYPQEGILDDNIPEERELGMKSGFEWARRADATIVYTDLGTTSGMSQGIANAWLEGRVIEFRELGGGWKDNKDTLSEKL